MTSTVRAFTLLALCGLAASSHAAISFGPASTLPAATQPSGTAIADFTGDGKADLAVTVDTPDRLLVYPGNGLGGFGTALTTFLPAGGGAGELAAADFDRDGDIDLAIAQQNSNTVLVYANNAAGLFLVQATIAAGSNPRGIEVGDLNADQRPDFVIANRDSDNVTVALNGVAGWTSVNIATGEEPRDVALGDLNGDGDLDLAVSNHRSRSVSVFSNTAGTFTSSATLPVNAIFRPDGIALVQVAGSSLPEVAVVISDDVVGSFVAVYTNTAGTLATGAVNYSTSGSNAGAVIATDFDNDGRVDLAVANEDSGTVAILAGTGTGFAAPLLLNTGTTPTALASGRLDANVMRDLAVANRDSNNVTVFLNTAPPPAPTCDSIDFNNDGSIFDPQDINAFISVYSEGPCIPVGATCNDIDFNNDTSIFDPQDINAFISVYSEGPCF